jgi:nicotinamidase-related amidase
VASTAWDAFERGFHVVVAADAVAAYQPELHRATLEALALNGAVLAETEALRAAWK